MSRFVDLTGQVFGSLTVMQTSKDPAITGKNATRSYSLCYCSEYDCTSWVSNDRLLSGQTKGGTKFKYKPLPIDLIVDEELIGIMRQHTWHNREGYYSGEVYGERISAHQYIWFLQTGEKVKGTDITLDHINRNRSDNRFVNLRKATAKENSLNKTKAKYVNGVATTSKYLGVSYDKTRNKWRANVVINGVTISLGRFLNEELAYQAKINYVKLNCTEEDLEFRTV